MADENRLIKLETKLAYQEKLIDAFSCVVINQSKSLHEISKEFNILTRRISDLEEQNFFEAVVSPFPHK